MEILADRVGSSAQASATPNTYPNSAAIDIQTVLVQTLDLKQFQAKVFVL
jgi:hypothetical protein